MIMGGDFNSRATEWGMTTTNSRGRRVLDMAARLGLLLENKSLSTPFRRPEYIGTIPDVTFSFRGSFGRSYRLESS